MRKAQEGDKYPHEFQLAGFDKPKFSACGFGL
jgi:hypothetical protein